MPLPFTREQFFDVFAAYNTALWPCAVVLWLLSALLALHLVISRGPLGTSVAAVLALHWAWSALAYHVTFFADINPAARLFAALFLIQAAAFVWYGVVRRDLRFTWPRSPRNVVAGVVLAYGLLYPMIVMATGHRYPAMPTFGVPCPTTIFTIGFLLTMEPRARWSIAGLPLAWTVIGGSAALLLGVHADLGLLIAGGLLAGDLVIAGGHH